MKVYVVGDHGPEHNSIKSIHKTYDNALKARNKLRIELLNDAKSMSEDKWIKEIKEKIVKNLPCENPDTIDNYPQETPHIKEYEVNE